MTSKTGKTKTPIEFYQMGWNCFANASTQAILSLEGFCNYLVSFDKQIEKFDDSDKGKFSETIIRNLAAICNFIRSNTYGINSPLKIIHYLKTVSSKCPAIPYGEFGDSKTFIISVFDKVDQEIEYFNNFINGTSIPKFASMSSFFLGNYIQIQQCTYCKKIEKNTIEFSYLLFNGNSRSIEDGFKNFVKNTSDCPYCHHHTFEYTCEFDEFPQYFFIQIQRGGFMGDLPSLNIEFNPTFENKGHIYTLDLQSVVFDGFGHSYAAIKRYGQWYISGQILNLRKPQLMNQDKLKRNYLSISRGGLPVQGYILFYTILSSN